VTPGVPAYAAAAALVGRELTVPEVAQTVILTRAQAASTAMPETEELAGLARSRATLVLHLAIAYIDEVVEELRPHYGGDCPVAVVARASRDDELVLRGTLDSIGAQVSAAGIRKTAIIVVGPVLTAEQFPDSHLYSTERCRN
jgi:precorrin-4/cobalt-precorrin-4 C11-methyltransferase